MPNPRDTGLDLDPNFDAAGLITAVVTHATTGAVLMVAHMNAEAFAATRASGGVDFLLTEPGTALAEGETSGNVMRVVEMRIDCDQDAVWLIVEPAGPACHTGADSCFFRRIGEDGLEPIA